MRDPCVGLPLCLISAEHVETRYVNILSATEGDPWLQCLEFVHGWL